MVVWLGWERKGWPIMYRQSMSTLVLLCMLAFAVHAQNTSGSISGRVIDQQGAVVPNASITVEDPTRGFTLTTKTNESGDFVTPGLQPGTYKIRVEAAGFKKLERPNIPLNVNDKLALGSIPLEVGAITES